MFQNLLANAIKFRSSASPRIAVSASRRGDHCEFIVADNGVGMPAEGRERLFQLFARLHGREVPGTGIGLATCREIIERHGGRIWVDDAEGPGTRIRFSLPTT